jgi:Hypoxanthine-guanine phosphoribosyltransferase
MSNIKVLDKTFRPFIDYGELEAAFDSVAAKINKDFEGCTDVPVLLCVLNGSIMFTAELMKRLNFKCELVSMKLSSYVGTQSTGNVREVMGMTGDVKGKGLSWWRTSSTQAAQLSTSRGFLRKRVQAKSDSAPCC